MAAGLGFKTFTTGEVLTAADTNGYLMQGILVFASAAARDAAITSPQEGQFAYLKDTNVTTYYTGSAWANVDTTGMTNPMTTTGDIIYASSGSTPGRIGIGSTGNVLTVAGGIPSWAAPAGGGGMTVITSGSLSTTSVSLSGLSGYNSLLVEVNNPVVDVISQMAFRFNSNSSSIYSQAGMSPLTSSILNGGPTTTARAGFATYNLATTADNTSAFISVNDYDSTVFKNINMGMSNGSDAIFGNVRFNDTTAITSIQITTSGGTSTFTGGTYVLYGVK
jgi:hypothetical protein